MPPGKMLERCGNFGQDFHRMVGDGMRDAVNLGVQLGGDPRDRQTLESGHQGMRKAVQAITVGHDVFPLDVVQDFANLLRGIFAMIEKRDEPCDGTFEIDVVLPERVVGIDQQRLGTVRIGRVCHPAFMITVCAVDSRGGGAMGNSAALLESGISWRPEKLASASCWCWLCSNRSEAAPRKNVA